MFVDKTYTIEQIADSIRKNGLKQYFGDFYGFNPDTGDIIAACAVGQAAYNLHESEMDLQDYLNGFVSPDGDSVSGCPNPCGVNDSGLANMIEHLNDDHVWSFEQIADWLMQYKEWTFKADE